MIVVLIVLMMQGATVWGLAMHAAPRHMSSPPIAHNPLSRPFDHDAGLEAAAPELKEVRRRIAERRARRMKLRQLLSKSGPPIQTMQSMRDEFEQHAHALADLEEERIALIRKARAAMIRKQRAASRSLRAW